MRFGLIGCGGIGQLRAAALSRSSNHELVAASDVEPERAKSLTTEHGGQPLADVQALIDSDSIDAAIVSTPPSTHAELCVALLDSGKHVLCEKPLARNTAECRQMLAAAERNQRLLATGFNYRFYPSVRKTKELLDAGAIGELDHIRSYTGYTAEDHDHSWLHDPVVMGGGALRDNGIHLIDLTRYLLGDVEQVEGFASNNVWRFPGCEDNGFALLRSSSGKIATLQASWTEWRGYQLALELYGTEGCLRCWCFPMLTQVVSRHGTSRFSRYGRWHVFPYNQIMEKLKSYKWVVVESFIREFDAFAAALNGMDSEIATGNDGMKTIEIAETASRKFAAGEH